MLVTRALESPVALVWLQTSLQVNALFNVLLIWYLPGWNLFSRLKKKKKEHVDENGDDPEWWGERDIREEGTNACYDGDTCASQLYTAILFKQQKRFLKKRGTSFWGRGTKCGNVKILNFFFVQKSLHTAQMQNFDKEKPALLCCSNLLERVILICTAACCNVWILWSTAILALCWKDAQSTKYCPTQCWPASTSKSITGPFVIGRF